MEETKEEEDALLHRPEGSGVILPLPPSRTTDHGDDDEKPPPHPSIMIFPPTEDEKMAATKTAAVTLPLTIPVTSRTDAVAPPPVIPPLQKNQTKKDDGGPRKRFHRVHKNDRQDETVSTPGDDRTKDEDESLSMMIPEAVSVGGIATRSVRPATPPTVGTGPLSRDTNGVVTPAVAPPQETSPFKKNQTKKDDGGPRKAFHRVHKNDRQDETVSTPGDDVTKSHQQEEDEWMMIPGAVSVGGIATRRSVRPATPPTVGTGPLSRDTIGVVDPYGTTTRQSEPHIVAFLALNDYDDQQVEEKIAQKVEERLRQQLEESEIIVASEVKDDSSTCCGLKKRTLILLGILSLLLITGGVVGGVLSSFAEVVSTPAPTSAPTTFDDGLVEDLISLGAISDDDIFSDPTSPQSQALAWMKNDTIITTPGRSTLDVLQRYVLAVLFYSTNGPNWYWVQPYLSSNDVCSWNKGTDAYGGRYGVYCLCGNGSVSTLLLSQNSLRGQLPWELVLLTNLEIINLGSNELTGSLPTKLGQWRSLESLVISVNQLTGTITTEVGQLTSLGYLEMLFNQLTGTIPSELGQLVSLTYLDMFSNQLTGTIPTELGQLVSLQYLEISSNSLTGTIPTGLGQLTSLTALGIFINQLAGTIPAELGQLTSLTVLDLNYNDLTGPIPTELGQPTTLTYLAISDNELTGTIPTELGRLRSLTYLAINFNQLTGTIPSQLAGIENATQLFFSDNALTGSLEQSFCAENRTGLYSWVVDCDNVECSCCDCG